MLHEIFHAKAYLGWYLKEHYHQLSFTVLVKDFLTYKLLSEVTDPYAHLKRKISMSWLTLMLVVAKLADTK